MSQDLFGDGEVSIPKPRGSKGLREAINPPQTEPASIDNGGKWDITDCECDVPQLEVAEGDVGPYEFQALYCEECEILFGFVIR